MLTFIKLLCFLLVLLYMAGCTIAGPAIDSSVSNYHYYNLTRTAIIYSLKGNCWELGCPEINKADISTFKPLNYIYAVDRNNVYYKTHIIPHEPPENFDLAGGEYAIGKNNVYWNGGILPL